MPEEHISDHELLWERGDEVALVLAKQRDRVGDVWLVQAVGVAEQETRGWKRACAIDHLHRLGTAEQVAPEDDRVRSHVLQLCEDSLERGNVAFDVVEGRDAHRASLDRRTGMPDLGRRARFDATRSVADVLSSRRAA